MSAGTRLMPYPRMRALEHAAHVLGLRPVCVHTVLLPVWSVEVQATVTEGEDYELIDRFLEKGIAEGGLRSAEELASFFALDLPLVRQVLSFLSAIGHVTEEEGGRVALTGLGCRSLRDDTRYTTKRGDRRRLYFDAFTCSPLTADHYTNAKVTFLSGARMSAKRDERATPLTKADSFRYSAVQELVDHSERGRFNLPLGIEDPAVVGAPVMVRLPAFVVRAAGPRGTVRHLVYTQARDGVHDEELSSSFERTEEFVSTLAVEEQYNARDFRVHAGRWLSSRGLAEYQPVRDDGAWRVILPKDRFGAGGPVGRADIGSYVLVHGGAFFQLWCEDRKQRAWALTDRLCDYLRGRGWDDPAGIRMRIDQFSRQLDLGTVDDEALCRAMARDGKQDLANRLSRVLLESSRTGDVGPAPGIQGGVTRSRTGPT